LSPAAYSAATLKVPADMLGWMLGACFAGMLAVAAGALGLYVIARADGRGIFTVGRRNPTAALPKASGTAPNGR
jgi:hypothetical protein